MKRPLTLDELKQREDVTVLDEEALKDTKGGGPIECLIEYVECVGNGEFGCGFDLWACMNG